MAVDLLALGGWVVLLTFLGGILGYLWRIYLRLTMLEELMDEKFQQFGRCFSCIAESLGKLDQCKICMEMSGLRKKQ